MRISKNIVPVTLALAIAGVVSVGARAADPTFIDFASVDANKDGKVTVEEVEYIDDLRAAFDSLDVNHDKVLSPAEFAQWKRAAKPLPLDPSTGVGGSAGSQHMPNSN
jgi:EF hand